MVTSESRIGKKPAISDAKQQHVNFASLPGLAPVSDGSSGSYSSASELRESQMKSTRQGNPLVTPAKTISVSHAAVFDKPVSSSCYRTHSSLRQVSSIGSQSPSPTGTKKRVAFGNLEMRTYPIVLGDHPDCSSGPPLAIGWDYSDEQTLPVDQYETLKPRRRSLDELELNYFTRKRILRRFSGVSEDEIREATDEVHKVQRQRSATKRMLPMHRVEEACESIGRRLGRVTRRGRHTQQGMSLNSTPASPLPPGK